MLNDTLFKALCFGSLSLSSQATWAIFMDEGVGGYEGLMAAVHWQQFSCRFRGGCFRGGRGGVSLHSVTAASTNDSWTSREVWRKWGWVAEPGWGGVWCYIWKLRVHRVGNLNFSVPFTPSQRRGAIYKSTWGKGNMRCSHQQLVAPYLNPTVSHKGKLLLRNAFPLSNAPKLAALFSGKKCTHTGRVTGKKLVLPSTGKFTYLEIRHVVFQQGLSIADVLFRSNKHKGDHALRKHKEGEKWRSEIFREA